MITHSKNKVYDWGVSVSLLGHNHRVMIEEVKNTEFFEHHQRGNVGGFSKYSKRRLLEVFYSFQVCPFKTFWTLTFRVPPTSDFAKSELHRFLVALNRRHVEFLWVMEFTKKGTIHFHLALTDFLDKKVAGQIWGNGFVYVSSVFEESGLRSYFVSEVAKGNQKRFHGFNGRWWGVSRCLNKKYALGVYNENLLNDIVKVVGIKRNYYRSDFERLGLDLQVVGNAKMGG